MHFPQQRPPRKSVFLAWNAKRNRLRATPLTGPHNMHDRRKALKTASPAAVRQADAAGRRASLLITFSPYTRKCKEIMAHRQKCLRLHSSAKATTPSSNARQSVRKTGKGKKKPRPNLAARAGRKGAATYSPALRGAVPSARAGLTSLFGMGRGGAPPQ